MNYNINSENNQYPDPDIERLRSLIDLCSAYLLHQAKETGLDINGDLKTTIKNANPHDVLFTIERLKRKSQKEQVNYPNLYFEKVLKDRQSKRFPGNFAA
jgi:hypothetical protein